MNSVQPVTTSRMSPAPVSPADHAAVASGADPSPVVGLPPLPACDTSTKSAQCLPQGAERAAGSDPARFERLAGFLEDATENLVGGLDVILFVFFSVFSLPVSMRRLEGQIEPHEAQALVDGAQALPAPDRRALAVALREMMASGTVELHEHFDEAQGQGAEAILSRFVRETLASGEATGADRAIGSLLAKVDTVQIALSGTHTHLSSAARNETPVQSSRIELTSERVEALRVALERVPHSLRETARGLVRAQLAGYEWPANASQVSALTELRAIIS